MKGIIIAAGSGKRVLKNFPGLPKALIQVNNNSIISRQISTFKKNGIDEIIVITGAFKEKFSISDVTYVYDQKFEEHDILGSLMEARDHIFGDVIITYSDIIFEDLILKKILQTNLDIGIAVDLDWKKAYEDRKLHPISEAENVLFDNSRNILEIRKNIQNSNLEIGEFLGIVKLSNNGCRIHVAIPATGVHARKNTQDKKTRDKKLLNLQNDTIKALSKIGVKKFKVASRTCKFIDPYSLEVLKEKSRSHKEIFISMGMGGDKEKISKLFNKKKTTFCYCVSEYPLQFKKINWNDAIKYDGFSDHTMDILAPILFTIFKKQKKSKSHFR